MTKSTRAFHVGARVIHPELGEGVIVEEWASWVSCLECREDMAWGSSWCDHCKAERVAVMLSGRGIFDFRLPSGKIYSAHCSRLELINAKNPSKKTKDEGNDPPEKARYWVTVVRTMKMMKVGDSHTFPLRKHQSVLNALMGFNSTDGYRDHRFTLKIVAKNIFVERIEDGF